MVYFLEDNIRGYELLALILDYNSTHPTILQIPTDTFSKKEIECAQAILQSNEKRKARQIPIQKRVVKLMRDLDQIERMYTKDCSTISWAETAKECEAVGEILDQSAKWLREKQAKRAGELARGVEQESVKDNVGTSKGDSSSRTGGSTNPPRNKKKGLRVRFDDSVSGGEGSGSVRSSDRQHVGNHTETAETRLTSSDARARISTSKKGRRACVAHLDAMDLASEVRKS